MAKTNQNILANIVVIGGGTGSFTLLSGLKEYASNITALVNMSDDGGSSGKLRDELGVLPPGDIRQCLVALAQAPQLRDLFDYRFEEGGLSGHSFGNLFISAVEKMTKSFDDAINLASKVLRVQGRVLPITTDKSHLVLYDKTGTRTQGEFKIGNMDFGAVRRPKIVLEPASKITDVAKQAILTADIVVIAPGNLYGSLAPALIVDGVGEALNKTKAKIVYVCNLVTKPNQTDDFSVEDYVSEIERFIGWPVLDWVIYNTDEPTETMLRKYTKDGEFMVEFDLAKLRKAHYRAIGLPLIDTEPLKHGKTDAISSARSLIRHDPDVIAREIVKISKLDLRKARSSPDLSNSPACLAGTAGRAANGFSSIDVSSDTSPSDKTVFARTNSPQERTILRKSSKYNE